MPRLRMLSCLCLAVPVHPVLGQDSVVVLPPIGVTAHRALGTPPGSGLALTEIDGIAARRGRAFATLEEMLRFVPGVFATDRGDATVDQRLAIRGSGARANFGIRGVRVLIDGVPATLPDGQAQLGALIPSAITRIGVARGTLGSRHGNASGGVIAFETRGMPERPAARGTIVLGTRGDVDLVANVEAVPTSRLGVTITGSESRRNGQRDHASALERRLAGAIGWQLDPATTVTLRAGLQHDPFSESPGALTEAEFLADPDQAANRSIRLDAGKRVSQRQLSVALRRRTRLLESSITAWTLHRDLENPIAAPSPAAFQDGVWIDLARDVRGARTDIAWRASPRLTLGFGLDWQRMHDDRRNRSHGGSGPVGEPFVDQIETVTEIGPFVHAQARLVTGIDVSAGLRLDRTSFEVEDVIDPARSGERIMEATTGSLSLGWERGAYEGWVGLSNGFETPTTTELGSRGDNATGLNTSLRPARMTTLETGLRRIGTRSRVDLAAWVSRTTDAILPAAEFQGRSVFRNVEETATRGVEFSAQWLATTGLIVRASATLLDSRFGATVRDPDGASIGDNPVPGVPGFTAAAGLTADRGRWTVDIDHRLRNRTAADDAGTLTASGWGWGITNAQLRHAIGRTITAHLGVQNAFDRTVIGSVVVNAAGGRYIQPATRRTVQAGIDMRF